MTKDPIHQTLTTIRRAVLLLMIVPPQIKLKANPIKFFLNYKMYTLFQQETKNIDWYFVILAFYYICTFIDAGVIRNYSRKARKNEK